MIQKVTEVFQINCQYLLTGKGTITRSDVNGISRSPQSHIRYIRAHEFPAYAAALQHDNLDSHVWNSWVLPEEMVGQNIDIAIQCNTDRICSSIRKGDVLFARQMPRGAWKSSMSSKRVYLIALQDTLHVVRISNNDAQGIYISQDDRDLPNFIDFADIQEVWSTISKWSPAVLIEDQSLTNHQYDHLSQQIKSQGDTITSLQSMITRLSDSLERVPTY